jgi:hypothetical protein
VNDDDVIEPYIDFRNLPPFLAAPLGLPSDAACPIVVDVDDDAVPDTSLPTPLCNDAFDINTPFEMFVDGGTFNGVWDTQGTSGVWDNNIMIWGNSYVTFSGPLQTPVASPSTFAVPDGGAQIITLEVHDDLYNPLVGGSSISIQDDDDSSPAQVATTPSSIAVPDGHSFNKLVDGLTRFTFVVADALPGDGAGPRSVAITVTIGSANGSGSFIVATGTVD